MTRSLDLKRSVELEAQRATLRFLLELGLLPPDVTAGELEAKVKALEQVAELDDLWRRSP